jgi:hypothetical protein
MGPSAHGPWGLSEAIINGDRLKNTLISTARRIKLVRIEGMLGEKEGGSKQERGAISMPCFSGLFLYGTAEGLAIPRFRVGVGEQP